MSEINPSVSLKRIVNYAVFVYGPIFLDIKYKNRVQQAPYLHCNVEEKVRVEKAYQDKGFMAPHESVLLALALRGSSLWSSSHRSETSGNSHLGEQPWHSSCQGIF